MSGRVKVPARELRMGDTLELPGWILHEDLAGLTVEVKAEKVEVKLPEKADEIVLVYHDLQITWFEPDEEVTVWC